MAHNTRPAPATNAGELAHAGRTGLPAHRRVVVALWLAVMAVICVGCAGVRVKNVQADDARAMPRPARVVVYDFATGTPDVQVASPSGAEGERSSSLTHEQPALLAEAMADSVATTLVQAIQSLDLPAERVAGTGRPEVNDLVIEGEFMRVESGSRTLRFVVGFGVGASELRTHVRIYQVTPEGWKPIQQFETVATSSRLPGVAVAPVIGGSLALSSVMGAGELRTTINADARRTAEQVAGKVSELKAAQGW